MFATSSLTRYKARVVSVEITKHILRPTKCISFSGKTL